MGDVNEACPESLDAQAREIWQESRANKIAEAGKLLAAVCRKCADRAGQVPAWIIELKLRAALAAWDAAQEGGK